MAYTGSTTSSLFLAFPSAPHAAIPIIAAVLTVVGNASYATSIVCANAFLPGLAREDEEVERAWREVHGGHGRGGNDGESGEGGDGAARDTDREESDLESPASGDGDEERSLLPQAIPAPEVVSAISTQDLAQPPIDALPPSAHTRYTSILSLTMSRLSSAGVALGFFSGVSVLALLVIPTTLMHGSTASMRLAIGVSAIWWAVFTVPAWIWLPGGSRGKAGKGGGGMSVLDGWRRVGRMLRVGEIRRLPNLYSFLLAWIFLSDGELVDSTWC